MSVTENYEYTPLKTEICFGKLTALSKQYRYVILGSLIAGFLAYTFMITNKLPNHDDLSAIFTKGATLASGRWGLSILSFFFPDLSMPWIYGVLSLLILTTANCLLINLFSIRNAILQFLTAALIITFPSQTGTFGYLFTAVPYAIAFLTAVTAAYIVCKCSLHMTPVGMLLMIFSISIYQAYLSIAATILVVYAIYRVVATNDSVQTIIAKSSFAAIYLIVSLGIYWGSTKLVFWLSGQNLGTYASDAFTFSFRSIGDGIINAYWAFFNVIRYRKYGLITSGMSHYAHVICAALLCIQLFLWIVQKRKLVRTFFLAALVLILPMAVGLLFLFVSPYSIHTLVLYSYSIIYILISVIIEQGQRITLKQILGKLHSLSLDMTVIGLGIILTWNIFCANQAYLKMHLAYENLHSFTTSIVTHLQSTPGYTADSKVALVGNYPEQDFYFDNFSNLWELTGTASIDPNTYSIGRFFSLYTGVRVNLVSNELCQSVMSNEAFSAMPAYPDYGYIAVIDDIFVIKLSN